jgi:cobalt-zinc-cadmium resistance protein CzcA
MIRKIVSFSLYQPLFIVLGLVCFIGAGIAAFNSLPVEAFPDVTDTQVTVITLYPGRAVAERGAHVRAYPVRVVFHHHHVR